MSQASILFPVLCQALLTLMVLILMGRARSRSMRALGQKLGDRDVRLGQNAWSDEATQVANNYKNQFELPVLFYAVCGFALALRQVDGLMIGLAWVFALSRIAHTVVHIGPNQVAPRGMIFVGGALVVLAMWIVLGWRVWTGAGA
jgi:hypothetical protein